MARTLDLEARQAINAQTQSDPLLLLVTLEDETTRATFRFVWYSDDVTYGGNVYSARAMQVRLPDDADDRPPICDFAIDNADQLLTDLFRGNRNIPATLGCILLSTAQLQMPQAKFKLRNSTISATAIVAELHRSNCEDEVCPGRRVTPKTFSGLFKPREIERSNIAPTLPELPPMGWPAHTPWRPLRGRVRT